MCGRAFESMFSIADSLNERVRQQPLLAWLLVVVVEAPSPISPVVPLLAWLLVVAVEAPPPISPVVPLVAWPLVAVEAPAPISSSLSWSFCI